jgi:hypothetical protein
MNRIQALAFFLEEEVEDIEPEYFYMSDDEKMSKQEFTIGSKEYLVLTNEEADKRASDYIKDSLWAFNADFLWPYIKACDSLSYEETNAFVRMIRTAQEKECEDCNVIIQALVGDRFGDLVGAAIKADGRGHFLSKYDGEEREEGEYFIYKQ